MIYTLGHSRHSVQDLIDEYLQPFDITVIIDVRASPYSRANPQFNCDSFAKELQASGVAYVHAPELGGAPHHSSGSGDDEQAENAADSMPSFVGGGRTISSVDGAPPARGIFTNLRQESGKAMLAEVLRISGVLLNSGFRDASAQDQLQHSSFNEASRQVRSKQRQPFGLRLEDLEEVSREILTGRIFDASSSSTSSSSTNKGSSTGSTSSSSSSTNKGSSTGRNVALLCSEFSWRECHRQVIAQRIEEIAPGSIRHLGGRSSSRRAGGSSSKILCEECHPQTGFRFAPDLVKSQGGGDDDLRIQDVRFCEPVLNLEKIVFNTNSATAGQSVSEQPNDDELDKPPPKTKQKRWGNRAKK
ncbi:unnamed protein product [Amoebophrya sp. A25]|nr:unnamed protein product [Amoebophrya sp. A25]|eukprot:GSA25T00020903001.1